MKNIRIFVGTILLFTILFTCVLPLSGGDPGDTGGDRPKNNIQYIVS